MSGQNFVLEIGVEELPAEYARSAWRELLASRPLLEALGIGDPAALPGAAEELYTPRRLAFLATGVPGKHPDLALEVTGPGRKVAFDAEGKPTRALEGFLKGQGVALEQLKYVTTPRGEYVAADVVRPGRTVKAALEQAIPQALAALNFPKTMRWEPSGARFARPIRWIVALLGGEPLSFSFADVLSGTRACGHRFFHPGFYELSGLGSVGDGEALVEAYQEACRERAVMVSARERRSCIERDTGRLAAGAGGAVLSDPELVTMTADLVEWPAVVCGNFDPDYLDLPADVIVTAMREHQRYFAVQGSSGTLLPQFLCVANASRAFLETHRSGGGTPALDAALEPIARGNERVLRARLDDARFYWKTDLARWQERASLQASGQAGPLQGVVWLEGWGTVYQKAERVAGLVRSLAPGFGIPAGAVESLERAAWLMKLDLTAEMIKDGKEFTSLEGRMGALYAARCGEPEAVTGPMASHYLPRESVTEARDRSALLGALEGEAAESTKAKLPPTPQARFLALCDRLDSVAGFFAAGRIPTGSEDPFGVRRAGNGLVALLLADRGVLPRAAVEGAVRALVEQLGESAASVRERIPEVTDQVLGFLAQRLRAFLADESTEAVNAALAAGGFATGEMFDPHDGAGRAREMSRLLAGLEGSAREDLFGLSIIFKRVSNILKDNKLADFTGPVTGLEPAEKSLLDALEAVEHAVLECVQHRHYDQALRALLRLRAPIDQFFLDVLVMAEDPEIRLRRLGLLRRVQRLMQVGWDFSQVSVPAAVN